jgi:hypothetical protein|tara:strand:- start:839 stop:1159 length:321 start_codon:yes stop_codon:yes gene_type:complete
MATTSERTVLTLQGMTIDIRSESSLYVTIGNKEFYIDDSTGEAIMEWRPTTNAIDETPINHHEEDETVHTCGGPIWGRLTDGCPRCDDLKAGAKPKRGWGYSRYGR